MSTADRRNRPYSRGQGGVCVDGNYTTTPIGRSSVYRCRTGSASSDFAKSEEWYRCRTSISPVFSGGNIVDGTDRDKTMSRVEATPIYRRKTQTRHRYTCGVIQVNTRTVICCSTPNIFTGRNSSSYQSTRFLSRSVQPVP